MCVCVCVCGGGGGCVGEVCVCVCSGGMRAGYRREGRPRRIRELGRP